MATTPGRLQVTQADKPKQDPRPLKQHLTRYTHEIASFLAARQCPIELRPTGPAFQTVFKFLINLSDPAVRFQPGTTTGKAWEEEFFTSLSVVGYPFERSISKSHLQAVGSTSTWANFVGLLHWLITLIDVSSPSPLPLTGTYLPTKARLTLAASASATAAVAT